MKPKEMKSSKLLLALLVQARYRGYRQPAVQSDAVARACLALPATGVIRRKSTKIDSHPPQLGPVCDCVPGMTLHSSLYPTLLFENIQAFFLIYVYTFLFGHNKGIFCY